MVQRAGMERRASTLLLLTSFLFTDGFHASFRSSREPPTLRFLSLKDSQRREESSSIELLSKRADSALNVTRSVASSEANSLTMRPISRRDWLQVGAVIVGGGLIGGATAKHAVFDSPRQPAIPLPKTLVPVNFTQAARETSLNVTLDYPKTIVTLDHSTFQKKKSIKLPRWVPPYLVPQPVVIRDTPDVELFVAAIVAGSAVEMARTSLLYPLLTLKTRIQVDINKRQRTRRGRLLLKRRLKVLQLNARRHWREGRLYAGIVPSLLVSVPATGVYYGIRDVVKRALYPFPGLSDVAIALTAAMVADVVSLMVRTPTDALAIRLQVATGEQSHDNVTGNHTDVDAVVGNWFVESIERLPAVILTDLPFLLSRITLNRLVLRESTDLGRYEVAAISIALLCAFLTTPFDVARTRILIDSDDNPDNGIDGGSGEGLMRTFQTIKNEGDGGVRNLFAGWLERTAYLGVGRAWLEPLQLLGYMWIRDAILLEWFD